MNKAFRYFLLPLITALLLGKSICGQNFNDPLSGLPINDRMLIQYTELNSINKVSELLKLGANVNAVTYDNISPLMYATQNGNYHMVYLLLSNKANPNIKSNNGTTALHAATTYGNDSIAILLINHKANINASNNYGLTPLHLAVWYGYPYLSDLLVQLGAAIDTTDQFGNTPLILSTFNGTKGCSEVLMDYGANPNKANKDGITPLIIAAHFNDTLQIRYLIEQGANIKQKDSSGFDALSHAIAYGSTDAIKLILSYKQTNLDIKRSYYQQAVETQNQVIRQMIIDNGFSSKLKVGIESVQFGFESITGSHNFMWGLTAGITERISKTRIGLHYLYRPSSDATLVNRNMQLYQFKEKRQILGLCLSRNLNLAQLRNGTIFGSYYGLGTDLTFRKFKGYDNNPTSKLYLNVRAGFFRSTKACEIQVGWDYTSLHTIFVSPHRLAINLVFSIHNNNNVAKIKQIDYVY